MGHEFESDYDDSGEGYTQPFSTQELRIVTLTDEEKQVKIKAELDIVFENLRRNDKGSYILSIYPTVINFPSGTALANLDGLGNPANLVVFVDKGSDKIMSTNGTINYPIFDSDGGLHQNVYVSIFLNTDPAFRAEFDRLTDQFDGDELALEVTDLIADKLNDSQGSKSTALAALLLKL